MSFDEAAGRSAARTPHVLVVDDDATQRMLTCSALEAFGMRCEEAADGESGLRAFERSQHDLVLLDVVMPGVDGFETCTRLRKIAINPALPILVITSLDDTDSIERAYACGATDFATKPMRWNLLEYRLRYMLRAAQVSAELVRSREEFEATRHQLLQSEKMASIGQLAAGVAHEINNPVGYVNSNLCTLDTYLHRFLQVIDAYQQVEGAIAPVSVVTALRAVKEDAELDYIRADAFELMRECREGIGRVTRIVQDLKDFSRAGNQDEWCWTDLHAALDSTINIANNEIKYKAQLVKDYGTLPHVECLPSQLNQVFMNILVNAAQAIEEKGTISVRTRALSDDAVVVEIADTGCGIAPENLKRIFEPFFTTKPVGKGTGLGLALSYGILQKHGGSIDVSSKLGAGTTCRICLPVQQGAKQPDASLDQACHST